MKIAVLGSGITGLLAAKACIDCSINNKMAIFDIQRENPRAGLHYLHDNCNLPLKESYIQNIVIGIDKDSQLSPDYYYSVKLYDGKTSSTSISTLQAYSKVYNMLEAYNVLHNSLAHLFVNCNNLTLNVLNLCKTFDLVISTIPVNNIIPDGNYPSKMISVSYGLPVDLMLYNPILSENFTVYNVDPNAEWYRASKVFGVTYTEFVDENIGDMKVTKVMDGTYENPIKNLVLIGRNGKWKKEEMAHHAYWEVCGLFKTNLTN